MNLTLEEIIVKGLDEKLRETNYRSKIFGKPTLTSPPSSTSPSKSETRIGPTATMSNGASQSDKVVTFSVPVTKSDDRHKSLDSSNSPGDSDYESAQVHSTLNVGRFTDRM